MKYEVIIIGGGSTGTATFRDLAMRGYEVALIEKNKIAIGTTKNSHQNLVSGLRYVIKDPIVAKECAEENKILSRIAPEIVGTINNYFVGFSNDYTDKALKRAKKLGIRAEELSVKEVLKEIPSLNKEIELVVETDDKNINAEKFCYLNCQSAIENNGKLLEHTEIKKIKRVKGKYILNTNKGSLESKYIINATGAWANFIAKKVNVEIPLYYSQGTIIVQKAISPRGIQYFHEPSDADAYIVHNGYGWLGTTSTTINNPEDARPEPWADKYLKEKFSVILPPIKSQKTLKSFTGIRPLFKEKDTENGRELSRDFRIYEEPENFFHILGGKLTTARLMGERISNKIDKKEDKISRCKTDKEIL